MAMSILNRAWRLFGTGFSFSIFGLAGLAITFVWFPVVSLIIRDKVRARLAIQATIRRGYQLFLEMMRVLGVITYRIDGIQMLQQESRCLIIANHPTLIDVVLIGSTLAHCNCIVKEAHWYNPFLKGVMRAAGYIPNTEGEELLAGCKEAMGEDGLLLIFPEGTRSIPNQPLQLQRGAANIAVRLNFDLRVVHIRCNPLTLIKGESWYNLPLSRPFFHVEVKERIEVKPFIDEAPSLAIAARRLNQHLAQVLLPIPPTAQKENPSP